MFRGFRARVISLLATVGLVAALLVMLSPSALAASFTVTNLNDSGSGSLREAVLDANASLGADTIVFAIGGTITLTSGSLSITNEVTIDGGSSGITISGNDADRVLVVDTGVTATVRAVMITGGNAFQLGGGILDNGNLTLDHVTVTGNTMTTNAGDFWQGGGGIYVGEGAGLTVLDSTISGNTAAWSGGAIYGFFNSTTTIARSTIGGNVSNDVGGAIRSLGTMTIVNSTITGNRATGWHGGAIFHTDGAMTITNSTIASNIGPDWAPSTIFIGQFGGSAVPSLTLTNSIVSGNQWYACELFASGGQVAFTSGGHNVLQDQSCTPAPTDQVVANAGLGSLADNGGPTRTIELLTGSVAIDAIPAGTNGCGTTITTDQRGYVRPAGAACDTGAFESGAQRPFTFTGFFSPVRNVPTLNPVKAGSAVSVKFSLNGDQGLDILAVGSPASQQIDCSSRSPQGAVEPTSPSGDSGLTYNATTDTYSYKWKTIKTPWRGTCRQLLVTLNDQTVHTAYFQFNK